MRKYPKLHESSELAQISRQLQQQASLTGGASNEAMAQEPRPRQKKHKAAEHAPHIEQAASVPLRKSKHLPKKLKQSAAAADADTLQDPKPALAKSPNLCQNTAAGELRKLETTRKKQKRTKMGGALSHVQQTEEALLEEQCSSGDPSPQTQPCAARGKRTGLQATLETAQLAAGSTAQHSEPLRAATPQPTADQADRDDAPGRVQVMQGNMASVDFTLGRKSAAPAALRAAQRLWDCLQDLPLPHVLAAEGSESDADLDAGAGQRYTAGGPNALGSAGARGIVPSSSKGRGLGDDDDDDVDGDDDGDEKDPAAHSSDVDMGYSSDGQDGSARACSSSQDDDDNDDDDEDADDGDNAAASSEDAAPNTDVQAGDAAASGGEAAQQGMHKRQLPEEELLFRVQTAREAAETAYKLLRSTAGSFMFAGERAPHDLASELQMATVPGDGKPSMFELKLWLRVRNRSMQLVETLEHVFDPPPEMDTSREAFMDAYRELFVEEFAEDLEAMRQQHERSDAAGALPLDLLVHLIERGADIWSQPLREAFLYQRAKDRGELSSSPPNP